ncbi:energy transducer TonB family protein [Chelonobacter oris]|uniref:energy transducer TonB family protein n=1 Tax=Chelonobacter oris TaxID=505317 RepID=UPI00068BB74A|nr:energy transducer TonB [Chelonobacter oris]
MIIDIPSFWAQKKYRLWLFNGLLVCFLHMAAMLFLLKKEITVIPPANAAVMLQFSDPPQSIVSISDLPLGPPQVITQNSQITDSDTPPQEAETPKIEENPFVEQAEITVKKQDTPKTAEKNKPNRKPKKKSKKSDKPSDVNSVASGESVSAPPDGTDQRIASEYNSDGSNKQLVSNWQAHLRGHLARYKRYPETALKQKIEGRPIVRIKIDMYGNLLSVSLKKSGGNSALDHEAVNTIKRASPLPKPPPQMMKQKNSLTFSLPIDFALKNKG